MAAWYVIQISGFDFKKVTSFVAITLFPSFQPDAPQIHEAPTHTAGPAKFWDTVFPLTSSLFHVWLAPCNSFTGMTYEVTGMFPSWKPGEFKRGIKVWAPFHSWPVRTMQTQKTVSI